MCFIALPRQVFEALFLFEQISDWPRTRLVWELLEENIQLSAAAWPCDSSPGVGRGEFLVALLDPAVSSVMFPLFRSKTMVGVKKT